MNKTLTLKHRILFTGLVTLLIGSHLLWDYFHGGVPSHYILHRKDLPSISNWWGGMLLPLTTWFLLHRIQTRVDRRDKLEFNSSLSSISARILGAIVFGGIISVLFSTNSDLTSYMMLAAFLISFFIPLYLSEFLLGYILGTALTFGVFLPLVGGSILALIFLFTYKILRRGILFIISKMK